MKKSTTGKRLAVATVLALISSFSIVRADDPIHNPSGITFPANIERLFTLCPVEDGAADAKSWTFTLFIPMAGG